MSAISFLNNRQLGFRCSRRVKKSDLEFNVDSLISRFACLHQDIYAIRGEEFDVPPFSCTFRKDSECHLLAVANEDGDILLYDTNKQASNALLQTFAAHENAIFDLCWLPDKCQLISGSGDSTAILWDMSQFKLVTIFGKHNASIKSVDVCPQQSAIFATGSRDGSINVWDTRDNCSTLCSKPSIHICHAHSRKSTILKAKKMPAHPSTAVSSVSAVAFQDTFNLASAGVADGVVKIWDLRKTYISSPKFLPLPKYRMDHTESKGCTSLVFDSSYKTLYGCSTGNKIFKFNCHTYKKEAATYEGFRCNTYFVKLAISKDDKYLLCGSSDDKAYIWKTSKSGSPIVQLHGHSSEVTSVAWSPNDITKLATCGDDNKVAIWKIFNTEGIEKDLVHAVAEPYIESTRSNEPLNRSEPYTEQLTTTHSAYVVRRSPDETQSTPNRPSLCVITNFFSPLSAISTSPQYPSKDLPQNNTVQRQSETSEKVLCNVLNKSAQSSVHVFNFSNLANKSNLMDQLPKGTVEHSSPEFPINNHHQRSSSSSDKENSYSDVSPETLNRTNVLGQTKRKNTSSHSTPVLKKSMLGSASKSRGSAKKDKLQPVNSKTIKSYFSIVSSSPEN